MAVSVRDIATQCGVSPQSVSHALRGNGRISSETRQRIKRTAVQMGYRPNSIARTMRSGRFNQVGVLGHAHAGQLHHDVIKGVCRELERHDLGVIVAEVERQTIGEPGKGPKLLRELSTDGLIVDYAYDLPREVTDAVESAGVPVVWVNTDSDHNTVVPDDVGAGRDATQILLQAGHRRIAFVCGPNPDNHHSRRDRLAGYRRAMQGVAEPRHIEVPPLHWTHLEGLIEFWLGVLSDSDRPEALLLDDLRVEPLVAAVAAIRLNRPGAPTVPTVTVGARGDTSHAATCVLARFPVPSIDLGRAAARMLLCRIKSPHRPQPVVHVAFRPQLHPHQASPHLTRRTQT